MAYQYGPCSPRKESKQTIYVRDDIRLRQTSSLCWHVETHEEFAGVWHAVNLHPESYFDALKRAEWIAQ